MKLLKQRLLFLTQSFLKPRQTGAVSPSSSYLASAMAKEIYLKNTYSVVMELGGGTGSLTKGLLAHGIDPKKLIIIEKNRLLARELKKKFPDCRIEEADAQNLQTLALSRHSINPINSIDSIISGLPLRSLPRPIGEAILTAAFNLLPTHGRFIQFTYGFKSPAPETLLSKYKMKILKKTLVLWNFPPATVWVYEKQES